MKGIASFEFVKKIFYFDENSACLVKAEGNV